MSIVLYALAWLITSVVVIRPRWKLSDDPDSFGQECVMTFVHVQGLLIPVMISVIGLLYAWWAFKEGLASAAIVAAAITVIIAAGLVGYFRDTTDRRSWLALRCLLVSSLIYGLSVLALYWFRYWCEMI